MVVVGYARERKHEKKRRRAKLARRARGRTEEALRRLGGDRPSPGQAPPDPATYARIVLAMAVDSEEDDPVLAGMEPEPFVRRVFPRIDKKTARRVAQHIGADRSEFELLRARLASRNPFYDAIEALTDWLRADVANGNRMWSAMANVDWTHESGATFSVSFRTAGGLVARLREAGEDYMTFYCSGSYASVCQTIYDHFATFGWKPDCDPVADGESWGVRVVRRKYG